MMHTIELLGRADKVHKIKLIGILKEYTGFGLDKTEPLANGLCNGEIITLSLPIDESAGNEFLMKLAELGVAIRDFSWHEEYNGGGLFVAGPEE